ncbi:MAG TPA: hypothetical protein VGL72_30505 [Bryobacteraceae bacterium]
MNTDQPAAQTTLAIKLDQLYGLSLSGATVAAIFEGLQEIPKKRADPAWQEVAIQMAMLSRPQPSPAPAADSQE